MWENSEGGRRRKPMGQNEQVPSKMGGGYQIDQVVDRLQEGRFRKTEKSQLFQSLEASFPLLSLFNSSSLLIKIHS